MERFHIALGVANVEASADEYLQCLGCRPDLFILGKYALWRTDAVNLSIRKVGPEEGGARREHGSGDIVWRGDAIQQGLLGRSSRQTQLAVPMRIRIDLFQGAELIRQFRDPLIASTNPLPKSVYC